MSGNSCKFKFFVPSPQQIIQAGKPELKYAEINASLFIVFGSDTKDKSFTLEPRTSFLPLLPRPFFPAGTVSQHPRSTTFFLSHVSADVASKTEQARHLQ